jgi:curved DNA-binding protein CbpA
MNASDSNLIQAFRILFEPDVFSPHFFKHLQLPEVRRAYRKRALLVHPDRVTTPDEELKRKYTEAFIEANRAYHQITSFLEKRDGHFRAVASGETGWRRGAAIRPSQGNDQEVRFYRGSLPRRPLFFGEFLYYSGLVPWKTLIEAIVWQRRQRPRFGEMARRWFKLSIEEIEWIMAERRPLERIGEAAVRQKFLTRFQANTILYHQRVKQRKIGEYFVEKGQLTDERVKELLIYFERFSRQFGPWRFR